MVIRTDAQPFRPVSTVEALLPAISTGDPRREALDRLLRIPIGQSLTAEVVSALKDGTFLVKIGDTAARMPLPAAKPGDSLNLTLIAREPRPTFALEAQSDATSAALSTTARLIDRLLQAIVRDGGTPPSVTGKTPLVDTPEPSPPSLTSATAATSAAGRAIDTPVLAAALREAVTTSGLFYESHLKQWADGKLPVADVLREPQAQIGRFFQPNAESAAADPRHQQMAALLGAQFEALDQQRLLWKGEAWPGLPMEWRVERDPDSSNSREPSQEPAWQSEVRFEMPRLGSVTATIRLLGNGLQVRLRTEAPDAADLLRLHGGDLAGALDAAGARLDGFLVSHGG